MPAGSFFRRSCTSRARRILTVSEHSKRDIVGMLGVPADRVRVVPNGVDLERGGVVVELDLKVRFDGGAAGADAMGEPVL